MDGLCQRGEKGLLCQLPIAFPYPGDQRWKTSPAACHGQLILRNVEMPCLSYMFSGFELLQMI